MLRCFMTWREQAAKKKQDEHRAIQLLSRLTRKKEVQALMSWREVASGMVADEAKLRRACGALLHSAEARAFGMWRELNDEIERGNAARSAARIKVGGGGRYFGSGAFSCGHVAPLVDAATDNVVAAPELRGIVDHAVSAAVAQADVLQGVMRVGVAVFRHRQNIGLPGACLFGQLVVRGETADDHVATGIDDHAFGVAVDRPAEIPAHRFLTNGRFVRGCLV